MPSKEQEFKQRFAAVLLDLTENGKNDPEAMWLIGSLASELVEKFGSPTWAAFKRAIDPQTYDKLLADFQAEGNRQHRDGSHKKAYAIQVLGISLIAPTQNRDAEIQAGDALLDQLVETTILVYRQNRPRPN